jgi:hypothetical protein
VTSAPVSYEALGDGAQRQLGLPVLRPAEVRNENEHRASPPPLGGRGQRRPDPGVVSHHSVVQRHVEVDSDKHALAGQIAK